MSKQHPWLKPVDSDWTQKASDAQPRTTGVVEMADGSLQHVPAPGSLVHQMGMDHMLLTTARSSGTAATRDAAAYGSYSAAREGPHERTKLLLNGATPEEGYRDERADAIDLDGNGD
jgi:hypothetical protein